MDEKRRRALNGEMRQLHQELYERFQKWEWILQELEQENAERVNPNLHHLVHDLRMACSHAWWASLGVSQ